jgi:NAD(P)-dependent dehydrogenase (short-subunit alcohol dehydrogenase family)
VLRSQGVTLDDVANNKKKKVSGSARGIGLTAASALSEAGSHVFCVDLLPEPTTEGYTIVRDRARSRGLTFEYRQVNLAEENAVKEVFDGIGRDSKAVGAPVRCYMQAAGIQHEVPLIDSSSSEFRRVIEVSVTCLSCMIRPFEAVSPHTGDGFAET